MSNISNDAGFREALDSLATDKQHAIAVEFVNSVLSLSTDNRVKQVLQTSANPAASEEEIRSARQTIKSAVIDSHTRCGAECDWNDQAAYFVARAAQSALDDNAAWQAAMASRMARNSAMIASEDNGDNPEVARQHDILNNYLSD